MRVFHRVAAVASSALLAGCSVFGYHGSTETPAYTVIDEIGPVTIRHYDARLAADTVVDEGVEDARNTGFKRLAGYIFGDNTADTHIAMTAPVAQSSRRLEKTGPTDVQAEDSGWRIRFFLPSHLSLASAPRPTDDRITLREVPATNYAVLKFTGSRDEDAVDAHIATLRQTIEPSAWQANAAPVAWFYDPPWTLPFLRRNEVAIPVRRAQGG